MTTTPQHPLGSGFGATSTADDVLAGVDLTGKVALVTGGYSGIGLETTRALTERGAYVIVPARRPEAATQALAGVARTEVDELDLADLDSVRSFAQRFLDTGRGLDLLVNNAGVMACPETRVGPGWELQFAANHLGHFTLANLLWPALRAGARVVALSSLGHRQSPIRFDDVMWEREPYQKWKAYGQSKTANSLFAVHLDVLGQEAGIRAFAVHPGGIMTPLQRHLAREEMVRAGWIDADGNPRMRFKTPAQGAATTLWAATSPQLDGLGGVYCCDCDIAELVPDDVEMPPGGAGVRPHAVDSDAAARLWTLSAELTGVDAFAATH